MNVTEKTVSHVADLAMLNLNEEEKERLTTELGKIITYMDKLNELDTTGIKPREHVVLVSNVFREDKVCNSLDREKVLQNAPASEDGCFRVPRVVE